MNSPRKIAKENGQKTYFSGSKCVNGHVSERRTDNGVCVECMLRRSKIYKEKNKEAIKKVRKKYIEGNRDKVNATDKKYRLKNKEKILRQRRDRFKNNPEKYREKSREYHAKNADNIRESRREYYRNYMREKRKDPVFKMKAVIRSMIRRLVDKTKANVNSRTEHAVGYTSEQLKEHIESKFLIGMSWENRDEWHVDHIKSIKSYIDDGVTDPKIINALSNLQPLWVEDNLKKGA